MDDEGKYKGSKLKPFLHDGQPSKVFATYEFNGPFFIPARAGIF
jgi:hypothetical protein